MRKFNYPFNALIAFQHPTIWKLLVLKTFKKQQNTLPEIKKGGTQAARNSMNVGSHRFTQEQMLIVFSLGLLNVNVCFIL